MCMELTCQLTTIKDTEDIGESWSFPGRIEDVLRCIDEGGFEQKLREVVLATPTTQLVDYKREATSQASPRQP